MLTDELRKRIMSCGKSYRELAKDTGIDHTALFRFAKEGTKLRLDALDKLAEHFGLELRPREKRRRKVARPF